MEVFIREKNCATCPFANKEKPNFICGDAIANDIGLKTNSSVCKLNYFANEEDCPLKSLDQHDAEIRKPLEDEIERLGRLCDKLNKDYLEQKEISAYGMKELNNTIRQLKQAKQELIDELLEWADSKMMDWINSPKYREPHFRGTRIIHYYDLQQKLAELLTPNKKGEK